MSRTTTSTSTAAAPKRRCAVYTRKSTTKGLEQEYNSLDAQEDKCKNFIAFHDDWQYERTFSDAGISGGTTERPALQELISRCQEGEFDIVSLRLSLKTSFEGLRSQNCSSAILSTRLTAWHAASATS